MRREASAKLQATRNHGFSSRNCLKTAKKFSARAIKAQGFWVLGWSWEEARGRRQQQLLGSCNIGSACQNPNPRAPTDAGCGQGVQFPHSMSDLGYADLARMEAERRTRRATPRTLYKKRACLRHPAPAVHAPMSWRGSAARKCRITDAAPPYPPNQPAGSARQNVEAVCVHHALRI